MTTDRRHALKQLALAALGGAVWSLPLASARAQQAFPSRPVRVVVPYAAGGTTDVLARQLFELLGKQWGHAAVIDNRTGAGGNIGADIVAKAEPDGYTLLLTLTNLVQAPLLYTRTKVPFDPLRDFSPISELATTTITLIGQTDLPYTDLKGLVQQARASGKPVIYGTYGQGSTAHLMMEMFGHGVGLKMEHVPYKGEMPLINDMIGGQVPLGVVGANTARTHLQSGKLRALAVNGTSRTPLLPDVPTFQEAGFSGAERRGWFGLLAPAGTPQAITDKIASDVNAALAKPEFRARMLDMGVEFKGSTPVAFATQMKEESAYWAEVIRIANVRLD
ncbi:MAG: tripartite tricarboxylate transporter substrate binding protein [Burkholderiaceae bacterium]|jgi:tripartite-type tricarboxylate transporter receptor subunit TctC|nr:tripartite tricarboxylate transporter substrate binding protein [Burkholderiaceae bacterium]